jgi:hypothetical protein
MLSMVIWLLPLGRLVYSHVRLLVSLPRNLSSAASSISVFPGPHIGQRTHFGSNKKTALRAVFVYQMAHRL